jgi:hypothetical protein
MSHDTYTQGSENYDDLIWNKPSLPNKINPDEDIIMVIREDVVIPILKGIMFFLAIFVMLLLRIFILGFTDPGILSLYDATMFGIVAILITFYVIMFHNYYLSVQIVTTERVIDIDQKGLFNREENTMALTNIEDISFKMAGFWGTIFNFGNVIIQTAGSGSGSDMPGAEDTVNGFTFNNVPHPKEVSDILSTVFHINEQNDINDAAKANAEALREVLNAQK